MLGIVGIEGIFCTGGMELTTGAVGMLGESLLAIFLHGRLAALFNSPTDNAFLRFLKKIKRLCLIPSLRKKTKILIHKKNIFKLK